MYYDGGLVEVNHQCCVVCALRIRKAISLYGEGVFLLDKGNEVDKDRCEF